MGVEASLRGGVTGRTKNREEELGILWEREEGRARMGNRCE